MRLTDYLRPELALTVLEGPGSTDVIQALSAHLGSHLEIVSRDEIRRALLTRERSHSTALGHGIAIPHATIEGLDEPILMIARAPKPIPFGPPETEPTWFFFVLLSPPGREAEHIKLLARICRLVRHPEVLRELRDAEDADAILAVIGRLDEAHV